MSDIDGRSRINMQAGAVSDPRYGPHPSVVRAFDGSLVVAVDLERDGASDLAQLIADARSVGIDAVWVSGVAVDASLGFERAGGYARFQAAAPLSPIDLPSPPPAELHDLQISCLEGIWGHHEPALAADSATFVGLHEGDGWVGVCAVDIARRRIVDPGVRRGLRTPDRYARLVRGAEARLGPGAMTLETRGDSDETLAAYGELGFSLVEYVPGWRLNLKPRSSTLPL